MLSCKDITNKKIWEDFILNNSPESFFQSWNWGEIIKNNCHIRRIGLYDDKELVGIAQISLVCAKRGKFLHIRHGPIIKSLNKKYYDFLVNHLENLGRKDKVHFLRISPLLENTSENNIFFHKLGFNNSPIPRIDAEYCWILNLDKSENDILLGMRKTTRYLIRQAQKQNVMIKKSTEKKDLEEFLKLYEHTAQRHNFVKHKGIVEEFELLTQENQALLFQGFHDGKLLSAAIIVFYNNQGIYHHSASIEQKIPVNYLLQWEAIKEAMNRRKKIYNFWGIAPENNARHPWRGLTIFKKGFGGEIKEYLHAKDLSFSPLYYKTYLIEFMRKKIKGY